MAAQLAGLQQLRSLELTVERVTEVAQAEAPQLAALTQLTQLVVSTGRWRSLQWHEELVEQLAELMPQCSVRLEEGEMAAVFMVRRG
jgi:hypothetical protein